MLSTQHATLFFFHFQIPPKTKVKEFEIMEVEQIKKHEMEQHPITKI